MKKVLVLSVCAALVLSCATNPFTGKKTMAFVPDSSLFASSFQQYSAFLKENKVVTGTSDAQMVQRVGEKIKNASEQWLKANGYSNYLKDYKWEYKLVQDNAVNAWCMPGGKIVVYSGLMKVAQGEAGLATVMGHEVAHALANHGQQRMSAGLLQQLVGAGVAVGTSEMSNEAQQMAMAAYGAGSNVLGMMPFSRKHESEADRIGLILMAIAGYNPDNAISFWQRMSAQGGSSTPEILSTHPSDKTRISNIQKLIPVAKAEAAKFGKKY
ncbi:M48 family metallopeptidase [Paenimyroides aestuarii]|uniref:M48 family metallopeptidase n=1 Tax=Paenimyroides aestuarii TaxID=2968490 RepID=A0ABY5NPM8_9FLAO|nr:M48 family metallopeptidase [Paenimyroides aestuarii]UUV20512.1 M48 family metallopeptidase [Paenimyroides aestuarii]